MNAPFYLVALEREPFDTQTIVGIHGEPDQKYVVTPQESMKPNRKKFASMWPKDAKDNLERLKSAGWVMDAHKTKCYNCGRKSFQILSRCLC